MNPYEAKLQARRDRLEDRAEKARQKAAIAAQAHANILGGIPMGQPVLVGHHSEAGHRRDLDRAHRAIRTEIDQTDKAQDLERRAEILGTRGISSDDPEAIAKLEAKLEKLEEERELLKLVNALHRKGGWPAIREIPEMQSLFDRVRRRPQFDEKEKPIPAYALSNRSAEARRLRQRIETLRKVEKLEDRRAVGTSEGVEMVIELDVGENRLRVTPRAQMGRESFKRFKAGGAGLAWNWSRANSAFQRKITAGLFERVCNALGATEVES